MIHLESSKSEDLHVSERENSKTQSEVKDYSYEEVNKMLTFGKIRA